MNPPRELDSIMAMLEFKESKEYYELSSWQMIMSSCHKTMMHVCACTWMCWGVLRQALCSGNRWLINSSTRNE
jgi:hypothetical protein